ncbi:RNA-directed DNA polymerase from mobile element jockey [Toxocara canis]|uniref:RNA-directed DNA polymerase from mobile element jockey n=1 Tax=Toxocara canis TaxID=6265 RepID=A0A0B2VTX2_TOXCA|nr:RNA-directed DNA polymerase from mobile element jockey [Toxocara canis]
MQQWKKEAKQHNGNNHYREAKAQRQNSSSVAARRLRVASECEADRLCHQVTLDCQADRLCLKAAYDCGADPLRPKTTLDCEADRLCHKGYIRETSDNFETQGQVKFKSAILERFKIEHLQPGPIISTVQVPVQIWTDLDPEIADTIICRW